MAHSALARTDISAALQSHSPPEMLPGHLTWAAAPSASLLDSLCAAHAAAHGLPANGVIPSIKLCSGRTLHACTLADMQKHGSVMFWYGHSGVPRSGRLVPSHSISEICCACPSYVWWRIRMAYVHTAHC